MRRDGFRGRQALFRSYAPGFRSRAISCGARRVLPGIVSAALLIFSVHAVLHPDGDVGATQKNGYGCNCHGVLPVDSVHVWIAGPESVAVGSTHLYTLTMTGGPAVAGGFDVAVLRGVLSAADTTAQAEYYDSSFEVTHRFPKPFENDTVRWNFFYQAPSSAGTDTMFSVANSVNLNNLPTGDQWNYGANLALKIVPESTLAVRPGNELISFSLHQNFPNPFNPSTTISFDLARESVVELSVFNSAGQRVASLLNGPVGPGEIRCVWNARELPSGVYFYRLTGRIRDGGRTGEGGGGGASDAGVFSETRKMTLVR